MSQDRTSTAAATPGTGGSPTARAGLRLPRHAAGGVLAAGVLASALASFGGTAVAATGASQAGADHRSGSAPKVFTPQQDVDAFLGAGYTWTDAVDLAAIWASPTVRSAKITAGADLLSDKALPFAPKAEPTSFTTEQDVNAYLASGYDHQDALQLAAVWSAPSVAAAKATAGAKILAGVDLPTIPKTFTHAQDVAAFSAGGYDHHDAVHLAHVWHSSSVHAAKVRAGAELLAGRSIPVQP